MITHGSGMTGTINAGLKTYYKGGLRDVTLKEKARVFYNHIRKDTSFVGANHPIPVLYEDPAPGSANFGVAQANAGAPALATFLMDVVEQHHVTQISTQALLRTRNDKGSFIGQQALKINTGANAFTNKIERLLFKNRNGVVGQVNNASFSTTSLDLVVDQDVRNIPVGSKIVFSLTETGALLDSGKTLSVSAVNRTATSNQVTVSANLSTISGMAQNAYIFLEGDAADNSGTPVCPAGLPSWLPTGSPSATAFFNVDRTADWIRLAGLQATGSISNRKKAITDALALLFDINPEADPDFVFMNGIDWGELADELEQDVKRDAGGTATAGFQYLEVYGPKGVVKCVPAMFCPRLTQYIVQMDTWVLLSMLECPRIDDDDGLVARAMPNAKGLEVRFDAHFQPACDRPGNNLRLTLS
jgi:hypothetical protein